MAIDSLKVLTVLKIEAMRLLGYSEHLEMLKEMIKDGSFAAELSFICMEWMFWGKM